MKILTNKEFRDLKSWYEEYCNEVEKNCKLEKENEEIKEIYKKEQKEYIKALENKNQKIEGLYKDNLEISKKLRKANSSRGGYICEINTLKEQIKLLNKKNKKKNK